MCPLLYSVLSGPIPCAYGLKSLIRAKIFATPKARVSYSMIIGGFGISCVSLLAPKQRTEIIRKYPDSKVHGANMGPTWVPSAPNGSHVGPMNLAIRVVFHSLEPNVYVMWHQSCNVYGPFGLSNITSSPNESANYWPCCQTLWSKMVILSKVIATGASWVVLLHFNVSLEICTKRCPKIKVKH